MGTEEAFINADLVVKARFKLTLLSDALTSLGLIDLGQPTVRGGVWRAVFEASDARSTPNKVAGRLLLAVEALEGEARLAWENCLVREFDFGYRCPADAFSWESEIGNGILRRISATGAQLRITIYKPETAEES